MKGIFLGFAEDDILQKRNELFHVIRKAGLQVFPSDLAFDNQFFGFIENEVAQAECAVLCMGNKYGKLLPGENVSLAHYQYLACKKKCEQNADFKLIVWHPAYTEGNRYDEQQSDLIASIWNDICVNISLTTVDHPIQLVTDLRSSLTDSKPVDFDIKATDIFLIYNQLDDREAEEIVDLLSDIVPVEKLNIIQDSDIDYSEFCFQQINRSKLAVIYFKESADWALPFAQQVWKKIGGASANTPILLIGDEDPETNRNKKFKAPKVASLIAAGELIALEIKVLYDKVIEGAL